MGSEMCIRDSLKRTDIESEEELFIAMALLPLGVDIGTKLHYECMEYSII